MSAGVMVRRCTGPPHRLGAQLVERRWQVLAVGARPQLQRQARIRVIHLQMLALDAVSRRAGRPNAAAGSAAVTKRLTDEDGVVARVGQPPGVPGVADAGLGDLHHVCRDCGCHPRRPIVVDLERDEIALVHAHQRGARLDRHVELRFVVHLHKRVEADLDSEAVPLDQLVLVQRRGDQQHAVGADQSGVDDVVGADREVLAQHG